MRCVKLYLPARENIGEFRQFLGFCAKYGIDTVMLEIGGAMEYLRHPEINEGWEQYASGLLRTPGAAFGLQYANNFPKNAIHCENGGGSFLRQQEVKEIADCCKSLGLRVIPEVPSLTHCDYLLLPHKELAERKNDLFPDHYCPSDERVYQLLFDVLEEVIGVFSPEIINIGHDELYTVGICPACAEKSAEDIYADDIIRIYRFLKERGIRTAMWADKLLCSADKNGRPYGGSRLTMVYPQRQGGGTVVVPAVYRAAERLPRDILLLHWHHLFGEKTDEALGSLGYDYLLANLNPLAVPALARRMQYEHCAGFCVSNWTTAEQALLQRNGLYFYIAYMWCARCGIIKEDEPLADIVGRVSGILFEERLRSLPPDPLRVVHTCRIVVGHPDFADGNVMDRRKDYLGEYEIVYRDGTVQHEKIYFGLHINFERRRYERKDDPAFWLFDTEDYLLESTYACRYLIGENGTEYEYAFARASQSDIVSWRFVPAADRKNAVRVISVNWQ